MHLSTCFKNVEQTPMLNKRIENETKKLEKFFNGRVQVQWTCIKEMGKHTTVIRLLGPQIEYSAKATEGNALKSLSSASTKMIKQLRKRKDKIKHSINRKNLSSPKHAQIHKLERSEEIEQEYIEEDVIIAA